MNPIREDDILYVYPPVAVNKGNEEQPEDKPEKNDKPAATAPEGAEEVEKRRRRLGRGHRPPALDVDDKPPMAKSSS